MMAFLVTAYLNMLYFITIFISALLLFLVQPMVARVILPNFGGGAAVWSMCMLFFQVLLLGGYCYAHWLTKLFRPKVQLIIHAVLLGIALLFTPLDVQINMSGSSPQLAILMTLALSIGVPYFVLAANAPLIQRWFSYDKPTFSPYKLYALSNVGSLLGLLLYPFIIEPFVTLENQLLGWSVGYWLFVASSVSLLLLLARSLKGKSICTTNEDSRWTLSNFSLWTNLSALGVVTLLAVTSAMTQNISSIPFLWLLPLCLYLVSFIVAFGHESLAARRVWLIATLCALPLSILLFFFASMFSIGVQVVLFSLILVSTCMLCHGELARGKPASEQLTSYYLAMSLGGVIGGLLVNFLAPVLFEQFIEFPLVNLLALIVVVTLLNKAGAAKKYVYGAAAYLAICAIGFVAINNLYQRFDVAADRNFYGQLAVKDVQVGEFNERRLVDGTTSHGTQSLDSSFSKEPLSYYRRGTGISAAFETVQTKPINAVMIGLGAGTLAAYGRSGDKLEFLELNPLVRDYATEYFTYIADTRAQVSVVIGDGRQLLATTDDGSADLLVVDAFSSDAIPVHLLTAEAIALYASKLTDGGILALHISNSHLDLVPLTYSLAQHASLASAFVLTPAADATQNTTQWVLMSKHADTLQSSFIESVRTPWPDSVQNPVIWTDDYSNLLSVLK